MVRRAERCAPAVFDATTAASSGTEATAAVSAATRGAETLSRPPSGVAPTARLQGAIATASTAEQISTPAAARVLRGGSNARDAEDRRGDEEGDHRSDAVIARIRHGPKVRQRVREQLRDRHERQPRREHEQEEQRQPEPDEVDEVVALDQRAEHRSRIREQHPDDALRRAADLVVETEEDAVPVGERGNDDVDGNERPRESGESDEQLRPHDVRARPRTRFPARRSAAPSAHPSTSRAGRRRRMERAGRCPGTRCRRGTAGSRTSPDGSRRTRSLRPTDRRGSRAPEAPRHDRRRGAAGRARTPGAHPATRPRSARKRAKAATARRTHSGVSSTRNGSA